ncbi:hypothetical protein [Dactylosporangium sp. CA-139066]|uniref:hypothetical protein n=1 Tax=Dactylosporangium sp. CA-139066 TaxID=3239930 RepID=UPI003D8C082A
MRRTILDQPRTRVFLPTTWGWGWAWRCDTCLEGVDRYSPARAFGPTRELAQQVADMHRCDR